MTSKGPLFKKIRKERYTGCIQYRPGFRTVRIDAGNSTIFEPGEKVKKWASRAKNIHVIGDPSRRSR